MTFFYQAVVLQGVLGYTALGAGLVGLPVGVMLATLSTRIGTVAGRMGSRRFLVAGPALMALGLLWFARLPVDSTPWTGLPALERHHAWKEIFTADARAELLAPDCRGSVDPLAAYKARYAETEGAEPLARLQDLDIGTFLADDLLTQTDRAGMAHGLEIRVPYLDPVVAQLALALPADARVRGLTTKAVLRDALAPLLPRVIVRGAKRGFCAPAAAWLRGPLQGLARDVLAPETLRRQGLFAPASVTRALDRHVARREDLSRQLWALLAFTLWHDAVLGPNAATRPPDLHPDTVPVPIPK